MLINQSLKGKKVATEFGYMVFNDKGETHDLTETQQKKLGALPGFKFVEDPKKAEPAKEEPKKEEPKAETKKAPARGKSVKKEEK
jgi:hypothetical protein